MTVPAPRYGPPDGDKDLREYAAIMAQAFALDPADALEWAADKGIPGIRVLRGGQVQAGLGFYRFAQFFGGRAVPAWGIAGVAVRPELRGSGIARELMSALLREMHDQGVALSPLYPASGALYRGLGWSSAGSRMLYRIDPARLPRAAGGMDLKPVSETDDELRRRYRAVAQNRPGNLDRNDQIWQRVTRASSDSPMYAYLAGNDGYILYTQRREGATLKYEMSVRDLVSASPQSASAIAAFLAGHATLVNAATIAGAPNDPLLSRLLPDQNVAVHERLDWMLRIVRVKEALEGRGYPPAVSGTLTLRVRDEALPGNHGAWTLRIKDGRAKAVKGGKGAPDISTEGLAALYSGWHNTHDLRALGQLTGHESQDAFFDAAFNGPPPWMPDFF